MRETLIDILAYLIENQDKNQVDKKSSIDVDLMADNMLKAGFHPQEVDFTVDWLEELNDLQCSTEKISAPKKISMRIFSNTECSKISKAARYYLISLEHEGIMDELTREIAIDRAMTINEEIVSLSTIKWISAMILVNQPQCKNNLLMLSELVCDENTQKH